VLAAISGGMYEIGDDMLVLGAEKDRLALVENQDLLGVARLSKSFTPLDLLSYETEDLVPSIYSLREDQRQSMLAVYNWSEKPRSRTLKLADFGLPAGRTFKASDVLNQGETVALEGGAVRLDNQPAHSVKVIKFIDSAIPAAAPAITAQVPGEANLGVPIKLSAQAQPAGVPALAYHWDLGDGTTADGPQISHAYTRNADFTVRLTVDGLDGVPAQQSFPVKVTGALPQPDGKIITALLWVPFNLKRDGSNPALVMPHGGPTGQMVDYWNTDVAALTSRGYICIAPNPRGSTGYGLDVQKANFQDLGGGDLKDEVAAVDFLKATGYVDPKKIGITGGSYGGFMTLMAISKTSDIWAVAVEEYGIISWLTMLKSSDPSLNEYLKALLGNPDTNRKIYEEDSPITYIRNAKAPLLVLQGDNDPRVPKEEAQQVVDILKKEDRIVDVHYYANEGHGFAKRENQIDSIRRTIAWFDQYLMGRSPTLDLDERTVQRER